MRNIESQIQKACVKWFDYEYPKLSLLFYSIPNGGYRTKTTAKNLKLEGARAGIADTFLSIPNEKYNGLYIEFKKPKIDKTPKGRQQQSQKEFQKAVEGQGYKYILCYSFDQFQNEVMQYMKAKL